MSVFLSISPKSLQTCSDVQHNFSQRNVILIATNIKMPNIAHLKKMLGKYFCQCWACQFNDTPLFQQFLLLIFCTGDYFSIALKNSFKAMNFFYVPASYIMYLSDFCRFLLCTCGWERRGERGAGGLERGGWNGTLSVLSVLAGTVNKF